MAKSSGTTRSVGSSTATAGRTIDTGRTMAGYAEVGKYHNAMRASLSKFAESNGWRDLGLNSAFKTLSETDNIRTVSIAISESNDQGKVTLSYETRIIENLTPAYESKEHDAFQAGLSYINGRRFDTIKEANSTLNAWVKKLNKMKIK